MLSAAKPHDRPPSDRGRAEAPDPAIDLARIEGRLGTKTVCKIGDMIESHPDKTLSILRHWLHDGE